MQVKAGGKGGTGFCIKVDDQGNEQHKSHYQITLTEEEHPYSQVDLMRYCPGHDGDDDESEDAVPHGHDDEV